ncbi:hypothetical protein FOA52_011506 [Chlamydomonas sp. UWO 241]|nr:hypothetical protein FOA52_011506 [Chlamydomonas sp. UWO 241]
MEEVARRLRELAADANVHILLEPPPLPPESESEEEEQQPRPKRQATGRRPAGHIDDLNDDFDDDYDDEKDEGGAEAEAESDAREGSLDRPSRTHRSSRPSIERPSNTYYPPPTPVARRAKPEEGKDGCCIVS